MKPCYPAFCNASFTSTWYFTLIVLQIVADRKYNNSNQPYFVAEFAVNKKEGNC